MEPIARDYGDPTGWWKVSWRETSRRGRLMSRSKTVEGRANAEKMVKVIEATEDDERVTNWSLHEAGIGHLGDNVLPMTMLAIDELIDNDLSDAEKLAIIRSYIRSI